MVIVLPQRTLCGGGASSPQVGVPPVVTLTATGIFAFLAKKIDPTAAEVIAGILAASLQFDIGSYCANDPPADPNLQASDIAAAINFTDAADQATAIAKIGQWFLSQYWYTVCQCDGNVTQPTPPTPSNPGPVGLNPGIPNATTGATCWTASTSVTVPPPDFSSLFINNVDVTSAVMDHAWIQATSGAPSWFHFEVASTFPAPVQWRMTCTIDSLPTNGTAGYTENTNNGNGTAGSGGGSSWSSSGGSQPLTLSNTWQQGTQSILVHDGFGVWNADHAAHTFTFRLDLWCTNPNNAVGACCPPDPILQQLLLQVISNITAVRTDVTNIQTDITTIDTNLTTVQNDVTSLTTVTNTLAVDVTNLQTDVTNLQTTIDSETNTSITEVNTTVTNTDTTVTAINTTVNNISAELTTNTTTVNQLQAYQTPFGYTLGTSHTGLTGEGSFGVTGLSGIFIELTTVPPSIGYDLGEPNYYFDVGWASVLDSNGFIDQTRIHAVAQVWQPRLMSEALVIGYSLNQGTVATITEILPKVGA